MRFAKKQGKNALKDALNNEDLGGEGKGEEEGKVHTIIPVLV